MPKNDEEKRNAMKKPVSRVKNGRTCFAAYPSSGASTSQKVSSHRLKPCRSAAPAAQPALVPEGRERRKKYDTRGLELELEFPHRGPLRG